jgi:uncharacterized protein YndB with AHSA1/START domain
MSETRTLVVEKEIPYAPEKVWRALTQSDLIAQWLMRNDFQPAVGHKFNFRMDPAPHWNGVTDCEVLIVEPFTRLSYTWNASGDEAATGLGTVVTWTLKPTERGVLLRMEQSGFRAGTEDRYYDGAQWGWTRFLGELERVVAGLS